MSVPDFQSDLVRGRSGEDFLKLRHAPNPDAFPEPDFLIDAMPGERRWDLELLSATDAKCLARVEVKTDSHDPATTPNFFMERYTRVAGQPGALKGGPWRAAEHGVDTFVYLYMNPDEGFTPVAYWFDDVPALVQHLDREGAEYPTRLVRGRGCGRTLTAVGWLVPRRDLRALARKVVYQ